MKALIYLTITLCSLLANAHEIAFLEVYDSQGNLVQYEPGSRFGHVALKIHDRWFQVYPGEGVKYITQKQLEERGVIAEILQIPGSYSPEVLNPYLGIPFDFDYSWTNEAYYCSELLGKLLGIPPEPMELNKEVWPPSYWHLEGKLGLSPDKLYRKLKPLSRQP